MVINRSSETNVGKYNELESQEQNGFASFFLSFTARAQTNVLSGAFIELAGNKK